MKTLVAGWFSFSGMGAAAGDLLARDVVCDWLKEAGVQYDVALDPPFTGGINWRGADPRDYGRVIFVGGPFGNSQPATEFLAHFSGRRLVGVNLSMLEPLEQWNPFDLLVERDGPSLVRPDLAFIAPRTSVPVVGVVLAHTQSEYKDTALHAAANAAIRRLTDTRQVACVNIDTGLAPWNTTGLRTAAEVECVISKMDVVLTTRLHGVVMAIKNGVPAVAVDPVSGGGRIRRQCQAIGWAVTINADQLSDERLARAFDYCLTESVRTEAVACATRAARDLSAVHDCLREEFTASL